MLVREVQRGFFNAYARIAERDDLDFLLHLGDYIYEASNTPPKTQNPGADIGRPFEPVDECRTLAGYRTRYAQYRSDPDVQRLHAALPMIATLDDHELADGAWVGRRRRARARLPRSVGAAAGRSLPGALEGFSGAPTGSGRSNPGVPHDRRGAGEDPPTRHPKPPTSRRSSPR